MIGKISRTLNTIWCSEGEGVPRCQRPMNVSMEKYLILSANDPQMSAAVMMAKVSWYVQYTVSGIVGAS